VLQTIRRERISVTLLVPTMIYLLLDHPKIAAADFSSVKLVLYGASPMSPTRLMEGLERIGPVFSQLYGQSECYPIMVHRKEDHSQARPHLFAACGKPVNNAEVRLLDDDGNDVLPGDAGEICVRSPLVMKGYWKQAQLTAETIKSGWLHTGDIARRDGEGFYYIVDRKKDVVVSGGFNVYPREVEDVLTTHASVVSAAVIGVPDEKWGEAVTALVVLRPGSTVSEQELIRLVKDRKGSVYSPKSVEFVEALPMTSLSKVDKKAIRTRYWKSHGRMVG
jgi:fatty-acyl-CoA synthase